MDLNRILVVMHTFADASHIHIKSENEPMFITYYQWIKQTFNCKINEAPTFYF